MLLPILAAALLFVALPSAVVVVAEQLTTSTLVVEANGQRVSMRLASDGTWSTSGRSGGLSLGGAIESAAVELGAGTSTPLVVHVCGATVGVARKRVRGNVVPGVWSWSALRGGAFVAAGDAASQGHALGDALVAAGVMRP